MTYITNEIHQQRLYRALRSVGLMDREALTLE